MTHPVRRAVKVLLIEDNPGDIVLTREALSTAAADTQLFVVRDGVLAKDFLLRRGEFVDAVRPDIILLDLDLPRLSGLDVLMLIKEDSELRPIPVIVLSSSGNPQDVEKCYRSHANCYVRKPTELSVLEQVVRRIDEFWLSIARLPGH